MWVQISVLGGILFYVSLNQVFSEDITDLNLIGFLPMTGRIWPGGRALVPAMEMALRDVNSKTDLLLSNYRLNFTWLDTQCDGGKSTNALYELLYTPPVKHMIVGPVCSVECEVQAQASHSWNISHGCSSPVLSNKNKYPRFFRILPPDTRYNLARIALLRHFNWRKVATINVALDFFSAVTNDFVHSVKGTDISIVSEEIFDNDPSLRVQSLKNKDARIILAASYEDSARLILCAAFKVGLYGPKIVWVFPGWYVDYWWRNALDTVTCTQDQMDRAAEGHFLTGIFFKNPKDELGIAQLTISEFERLLPLEPTYTPDTKQYEFLTATAYDSIWGAALALNCTDAHLKYIGHSKALGEFEYADVDMADIVTACLYNVSFRGLSGNVKFDREGEPLKNIRLDQIRNLTKVEVATYVIENEPWHFEWQPGGIVWRGGVAPRDSTEITYTETRIPDYLYILMTTLSALGMLLAIVFLVFNLIYRNHAYVKLSSPNINNVLQLGCLLSYSTVLMYCDDCSAVGKVVYCKMRTFTFTFGFTMAFGAMFSKTWRVYRIFCNKKLLRLKIHDSQLIAIVVGLLCVMTTVLIVWEIVDPLYLQTIYLETQMYMAGNDAEVRPYLRGCVSHYYSHFLWTICITEGVLLAFGAFLAFETRKVRIDGLNDSRHIGLCLYNVVILSALGLVLSLLLESQVKLLYGITSGLIILGTTTTQLIVFLPKVNKVFYPDSNSVAPQTIDGIRLGTMRSVSSKVKPGASSMTKNSVASQGN